MTSFPHSPEFDLPYQSAPHCLIPAPPALPDAPLSLNRWGFADTQFLIDSDGNVQLTGARYALCGQVIDRLLPWSQSQLGLPIVPGDAHPFAWPLSPPASRLDAAALAALQQLLGDDGVSTEPLVRQRHGHGHSQEDIWAVNYEGFARIPDAVAWPRGENDARTLLLLAQQHGLALIPYGGGTNVTAACRCPTDEARPIISVDTSRMNRVRWIDPINRIACIEAGATGAQIHDVLARHGYTLGHEPDSYELSTLGGWIATHASGMKKNRYGNIEDIVIDCRVLTPSGELLRRNVADRESIGFDHRRLVLGSEGRFGIITQALVKVHALPAVQMHESILFPDFATGVRFFHDLQQSGQLPASIRLMDNRQFMLGQCLKPTPAGVAAVKSALQKWYLRRVRGFDLDRIAACTVLFEGAATEVKAQRRTVTRLMQRHGGLYGGAGNGKQGYSLTFGIAYLRDFLLTQWIIAESFETTVPWSGVLTLCAGVRERVEREHRALGLPGKPFLSQRLTQAYHGSACLYFYLGFHYKGVAAPSAMYTRLEHAAREAVLQYGGTLSHHHGIGKIRQGFLPQIASARSRELNHAIKDLLDPDNLLVCGNQ
jgi:alkyldihydroxyacetonephosphate synthase